MGEGKTAGTCIPESLIVDVVRKVQFVLVCVGNGWMDGWIYFDGAIPVSKFARLKDWLYNWHTIDYSCSKYNYTDRGEYFIFGSASNTLAWGWRVYCGAS